MQNNPNTSAMGLMKALGDFVGIRQDSKHARPVPTNQVLEENPAFDTSEFAV